jgi:hypothetical protein
LYRKLKALGVDATKSKSELDSALPKKWFNYQQLRRPLRDAY